jgi:hypothetical protein
MNPALRIDDTRAFVSVCAWCPDKAQRDAAARAAGQRVSHGICDICMARELAAFRLRQVARDMTPSCFSVRSASPIA